jgi:hypothetical protein
MLQEAESKSHLQNHGGRRFDFYSPARHLHIYSPTLSLALSSLQKLTPPLTEAQHHPAIKYTEALQLPYVQACMWEGLRICPHCSAYKVNWRRLEVRQKWRLLPWRYGDWEIVDPVKGVDLCTYGIYIQGNMNLSVWPRQR